MNILMKILTNKEIDMPCYTPPHSYCNHDRKSIDNIRCDMNDSYENLLSIVENISNECEEQKNYYKKKSDESTSLLCEIMKKIEEENLLDHYPERFKQWYEKHKQFDKSKGE